MARRKDDARTPAGVTNGMPAELAVGPDPRLWDGRERKPAAAAWRSAAFEWSRARGLTWPQFCELLDPDVAYAVSARGRHHAQRGGFVPPWERGSR